MINTYLAFQCI